MAFINCQAIELEIAAKWMTEVHFDAWVPTTSICNILLQVHNSNNNNIAKHVFCVQQLLVSNDSSALQQQEFADASMYAIYIRLVKLVLLLLQFSCSCCCWASDFTTSTSKASSSFKAHQQQLIDIASPGQQLALVELACLIMLGWVNFKGDN